MLKSFFKPKALKESSEKIVDFWEVKNSNQINHAYWILLQVEDRYDQWAEFDSKILPEDVFDRIGVLITNEKIPGNPNSYAFFNIYGLQKINLYIPRSYSSVTPNDGFYGGNPVSEAFRELLGDFKPVANSAYNNFKNLLQVQSFIKKTEDQFKFSEISQSQFHSSMRSLSEDLSSIKNSLDEFSKLRYQFYDLLCSEKLNTSSCVEDNSNLPSQIVEQQELYSRMEYFSVFLNSFDSL